MPKESIPNSESVDVLIHSTGGDPLAAWKLMSVLRERFKRVDVLVPYMAFSAATLFTLGADEIVLHPHASLGPIDPQIYINQPDRTVRQFAYEDVGAFIRFLATDVRVTEQVHVSAIIEKLFSVVDPVNVGAAKRASELSSSVGERLLSMHMITSEDKARAKEIAQNLDKSFFAHGDAVSRTRARELQLKIAEDDTVLNSLIWNAYVGLETYMELRKIFVPLQHYLADRAAAASLLPPGSILLPPNTPPQVVQQIWNAVMQNAVQRGPGIEVPYLLVNSVVESVRTASENRTIGKMSAVRMPNGEIQLSVTDTESGWRSVETPPLTGGSDPSAPLLT